MPCSRPHLAAIVRLCAKLGRRPPLQIIAEKARALRISARHPASGGVVDVGHRAAIHADNAERCSLRRGPNEQHRLVWDTPSITCQPRKPPPCLANSGTRVGQPQDFVNEGRGGPPPTPVI